jgi:hypothetical protein
MNTSPVQDTPHCPNCNAADPSVRAMQNGHYVAEQLMEAELGRRLAPGERVHFRNGNGLDTRLGNLVLCEPMPTQSYRP